MPVCDPQRLPHNRSLMSSVCLCRVVEARTTCSCSSWPRAPPPEPRQKAIWGARSRWWARGCMRRMPSGIYMIASSAKDAPRCLPSAADRPEDVGGLHRLEYQDGASRTLTWAAVTEAALEQARRVPLPPTLISRWHAPCGGCADRGSSVSAQRPLRVVQRASGRMSPRADVGTALGAR
jgi:hypothetical protein